MKKLFIFFLISCSIAGFSSMFAIESDMSSLDDCYKEEKKEGHKAVSYEDFLISLYTAFIKQIAIDSNFLPQDYEAFSVNLSQDELNKLEKGYLAEMVQCFFEARADTQKFEKTFSKGGPFRFTRKLFIALVSSVGGQSNVVISQETRREMSSMVNYINDHVVREIILKLIDKKK